MRWTRLRPRLTLQRNKGKILNNRKLGEEKEQLAAQFLETKGYSIVSRNFSCRTGEIDIIAVKDRYICFTEVKYRKNSRSGTPESAVTTSKMIKICKCAEYFLHTHSKFMSYQMRFDVIAIENEEIRHYENAFSYVLTNSF